PSHPHLMLHGCRKVPGPPRVLVWAGGERATLEQDLERFHQIEGLSLRFSKEPLAKAFQVRRPPPVFAPFPPECLKQAQDVLGGERAKLQMGQRHCTFHASSLLGKRGPHSSFSHAQREEQECRPLALR